MTRQATEYNEIIGIADGEIVVLEDTFKYDSELQGATGFTVAQLTDEMIEEAKDPDNMVDLWQEAVRAGATTDGLKEWTDEVNAEYNLGERQYFGTDDTSEREEMDEIFAKLSKEDQAKVIKEFGEIGKDFRDWDVRSFGRCIPTDEKDYSLLLRPDLLEKVREAERVKD